MRLVRLHSFNVLYRDKVYSFPRVCAVFKKNYNMLSDNKLSDNIMLSGKMLSANIILSAIILSDNMLSDNTLCYLITSCYIADIV
jgi:hypothetical protein